MIAVIVLMDQVIRRPLIAWSEKFKFEQVEASQAPRSPILHLLRHSRVLGFAGRAVMAPLSEALSLHLSRTNSPSLSKPKRQWRKFVSRVLAVVMVLGVIYAVMNMGLMVARVSRAGLSDILRGAGATFLRVELVLIVAALWTVPVESP